MLTRGYIIGNLIDNLSDFQGRIAMRCSIGLTDLNKYSEDFIAKVLNEVYGWNLKNLNARRSNEPGLDLGDKTKKVGVQVSSTVDSAKVNKTLKAITDEQLVQYDMIKIMVLGTKQQSYSAIDSDVSAKCRFSVNDIIDFTDVSRELAALDFDRLYNLHLLFEKEFQKVLIDLEIPNSAGKYPTSLSDKLETIPNTFCKNGDKFLAQFPHHDLDDLERLFEDLAKLPRITREFLEIFVRISKNSGGEYVIHHNELKRKLHIGEKEILEEIFILDQKGFLRSPDEHEELFIRSSFEDIMLDMLEYGKKENCTEKLIVALDFTLLDS